MTPGMFASLVTEDQVVNVVNDLTAAVAKSFLEEMAPGRIVLVNGLKAAAPTAAKVKERGEVAFSIFRVLRGDLQWSIPRIRDELPKYLRMELDGIPWEPEAKRSSWLGKDK